MLNRIRTLKKTVPDLCYGISHNTINVVTISQPWASLLIQEEKSTVVRRWSTSYRGVLYIHTPERRLGNKEKKQYKEQLELLKNKDFKYGKIIAKAKLVNCILIDKTFLQQNKSKAIYKNLKEGYYLWCFEEVSQIEKPILASGNTSIWVYEFKNA